MQDQIGGIRKNRKRISNVAKRCISLALALLLCLAGLSGMSVLAEGDAQGTLGLSLDMELTKINGVSAQHDAVVRCMDELEYTIMLTNNSGAAVSGEITLTFPDNILSILSRYPTTGNICTIGNVSLEDGESTSYTVAGRVIDLTLTDNNTVDVHAEFAGNATASTELSTQAGRAFLLQKELGTDIEDIRENMQIGKILEYTISLTTYLTDEEIGEEREIIIEDELDDYFELHDVYASMNCTIELLDEDGTVLHNSHGEYHRVKTVRWIFDLTNHTDNVVDLWAEIRVRLVAEAPEINNAANAGMIGPNGPELDSNSISTPIHPIFPGDDGDTATVKIIKHSVGNANTRLKGAKFQLYLTDGTLYNDIAYTTDMDGEFSIDLPQGEYYLLEIQSPDGYELSDTRYYFTIEEKNGVLEVEYLEGFHGDSEGYGYIENYPKQDTLLKFIKYDKDGMPDTHPLEGVKFLLYQDDNSSWNETYTTKMDGMIEFMPTPGTYRLREIAALEGYRQLPEEVTIVVGNGDVKVYWGDNPDNALQLATGETNIYTIPNEKIKNGVSIKKISSLTGALLDGAEFALYYGNGQMHSGPHTAGDGYLFVDELEFGSYYFVETKAPVGYELSETTYHFSIDAGGDVIYEEGFVNGEAVISNNPIMQDIGFIKYDADGTPQANPLEGIPFTLYTLEGENNVPYLERVTNSGGYMSFEELPYGTYYLKEDAAPEGYRLLDQKIKIVIGDTVSVYWDESGTSIQGISTSEYTGYPIPNQKNGGENPGGENPGGENPGGENPGGENPGGENPGGENPGGENPGGENPGGENPGGENPGGENPGGENPGGENPGGENPGKDKDPGTDEPDNHGNPGGGNGGGRDRDRTVNVGRDIYINDLDIPLANELLTIFEEDIPLSELSIFDIPDTGMAQSMSGIFAGGALFLAVLCYKRGD